ncbi:MAG: CapA family protein [Oscillospiraceae bacterium]
MNKQLKIVIGLCICLCFIGISVCFFSSSPVNGFSRPQPEILTAPTPTPAPTVKPAEKVSFIAAGDNLIHGMLYLQAAARANNNGYDFGYPYENIESYIKQFDIKFINQETLVNDAFAPSTYPQFSSPTALGERMIDVGFNVFGTSNNHSYDKGEAGIKSSLEFWNSKSDVTNVGFYTGNDDYDIKYRTANGIKMAFLAYTAYTNGLSIYDDTSPYVIFADNYEVIQRQIKAAKENSDIVIVSCHWGVEGTNDISQQQKDTASKLSEFGADVIIGTHPHVIQTVEVVSNEVNDNKTLVCYSLGNFISAQSAANNMLGGMFQFDIVKTYTDPQGSYEITVENPYLVPIITHYDYNYSNIRNYLLKDYTPELAKAHGVRALDGGFSLDNMEWIVNNYIPQEYLLYK